MYRFHGIYACRKNLDYSNLLSLNGYKNNDKIIYKYLKEICVESQV